LQGNHPPRRSGRRRAIPSDEEAFFARVAPSGDPLDCWIWTGAIGNGYGNFRGEPAYRWSYKFFIGPIPQGLDIDHECNNRPCVNAWHLDPVTPQVNARRRIERLPSDMRPKYEAVQGALRARILSGELVGRLPLLRDLATECRVSWPTFRHALDLLHKEGLVDDHGYGEVYVRPQSPEE